MDLGSTKNVSNLDTVISGGCSPADHHTRKSEAFTRTVHVNNGVEAGKQTLVDRLQTLQVNPPINQQDQLPVLKRRYSHQSDGRPPEKLLRYSGSTSYCQLISARSQVPDNIKLLIMYFGDEGLKLLMQQNPGLLYEKLESLDGLKKATGILRGEIEDIDFRGCSMNGAEFKNTTFKRCKFTTEQLNSADLECIGFKHCSFEGDCFASSVLENARFYPKQPHETSLIADSTRQISQIIFQSCVNRQGELNLEQWLEVMDKNGYFCHYLNLKPLDEITKKTLIEQTEIIKSEYPQKLRSIIFCLFGIRLYHDESALSFINNNREFCDRKVSDLRAVYFDFRTTFFRNRDAGSCFGVLGDLLDLVILSDNEDEDLLVSDSEDEDLVALADPVDELLSPLPIEDMLALIINIIEFLMFPHPKHEYIEFGVNANSVDEASEKSAGNLENKTSLYFGSDYKQQSWMESALAPVYLWGLEGYRNNCLRIWKSCSGESKLKIAKYCLRHKIVAVDHCTTVEFMKLLVTNKEGEPWLDNFAANMNEHKNNERKINLLKKILKPDIEDYNSKEIDESLEDFEQWVKEVAPDFTMQLAAVTAMEH